MQPRPPQKAESHKTLQANRKKKELFTMIHVLLIGSTPPTLQQWSNNLINFSEGAKILNFPFPLLNKCLKTMGIKAKDQKKIHLLQGGFGLPKSTKNISRLYLPGGFKHFLFSPLLGEDFHFDQYFSDGLKPPTSYGLFAHFITHPISCSH